MPKNIIFFDLDGTILNHRKRIPESAKQAIAIIREKGNEVAIATGRAPFMFSEVRKELQINTYVSCNGQYVVFNGEEIYTNPLPLESLEVLTNTAEVKDNPIVYMDHEDMKTNVPHSYHIEEGLLH